MRKLGIWDGLFQEMGQPRPSIRPVVDQQPVWWDHLLHPEDVLPVALDAALLRCCLTGVDPLLLKSSGPPTWGRETKTVSGESPVDSP